MELHLIATVLALIIMVVGTLGTIFPVLPGSVLNAVTALAWAWVLGSGASWTFGMIALGLALSLIHI